MVKTTPHALAALDALLACEAQEIAQRLPGATDKSARRKLIDRRRRIRERRAKLRTYHAWLPQESSQENQP